MVEYSDGLTRSQRTRLKQRQRDMQAILDLPLGRRFLCEILDLCGYAERCMGTNTADSLHRLSRRSVAVDLVDALQAVDPRALQRLLDEAAVQRHGQGHAGVSDDNE